MIFYIYCKKLKTPLLSTITKITKFKGFGRNEFSELEKHFHTMFSATLDCTFTIFHRIPQILELTKS